MNKYIVLFYEESLPCRAQKVQFFNVFGALALVGAMTTGATLAMPSSAMAETNSGTINITHTPASGDATATGMQGVGNSNTLTNTGIIITTATSTADTAAYANGMLAEENNTGTNTLSNSGTITGTATSYGYGAATAYGMADQQAANSSSELINSGTIDVTAIAKEADGTANAYGMYVGASKAGTTTLTNNGTITATATTYESAATTYGMYASGGSSFLNNNGTITVTTTSDKNDATAYGMYASAASNKLNNYGTITATATSNDGDASAYGMYAYGSGNELNNYGIINVSATSSTNTAAAYQAYIYDTGTIGTWNMLLGEDYGTNGYYVFGVANNATLTFNDDTKFVFVGTGSKFESGVEYNISDMISSTGSGTATGSVGSVTSAFDFLQVELINPDAEYTSQSIKGTVNLTAKNSPAQSAASNAMSGAFAHMGKLGGILASQRGGGNGGARLKAQPDTAMLYADAGGTTTDASASYLNANSPVWDTFIMPFYGHTSENGGDYSTDMFGLAMGASRSVCQNVDLGFHLSIAKADGKSDYTDSNATSFALGMHGVYNVDKDWYVRGQLSGFYSESDLDIFGSSSNKITTANTDMDTFGVYMELATGYDFAIAPQHTITPEIALSYMYAHMEGFNTEYYVGTAPTGTTLSMHSENFDALYADASVRWTGAYGLEKGVLHPTAKIGLRQALTDPEVSSTMEIFGTKSTTHSDLNKTAFTCEAGLTWNLDDVALTLTYMGEFGDVEHSHMGMFKTMWEF